jgi:hypothetical protein
LNPVAAALSRYETATTLGEEDSMTEAFPETNGSRRTVASYSSYADAERAVDYLSDRGFDVSRAAIVGRTSATSSRSPDG